MLSRYYSCCHTKITKEQMFLSFLKCDTTSTDPPPNKLSQVGLFSFLLVYNKFSPHSWCPALQLRRYSSPSNAGVTPHTCQCAHMYKAPNATACGPQQTGCYIDQVGAYGDVLLSKGCRRLKATQQETISSLFTRDLALADGNEC